jgi:hypothetical protein
VPLCWGVTHALLDLFGSLPAAEGLFSPDATALAAGYGAWLLLFLVLPPPVRAYIWAHELTHALWALLSGSKVHRIHVGASRGYVEVSDANMLMTLAPYFFPLYTMIAIAARLLLGLFLPMEPWRAHWLFLVGLTWGFHLTFTIRSLVQHQPDITACGRLLSYSLIYSINVLGIGLWIVATTPATFGFLAGRLVERTAAAYVAAGESLASAGQVGHRLFDRLGGVFRPSDVSAIEP